MRKVLLYILPIIVSSVFAQKIEVHTVDLYKGDVCMAPTFFNDGIAFCSDRKNSITKSFIDPKTGNVKSIFDIYFCDITDSTQSNIKPFPEVINSSTQEGPCTFSSDGEMMIFTRSQTATSNKKRNTKTSFGLYISNFRNGTWSEPLPFAYNSTEYNLAQPFLSPDNEVLYFVSDMQGGFGGKDIWKSVFKDGSWQKPINPGARINTTSDEMFPFLEKGNSFYFSTNRDGNSENFDIYKIENILIDQYAAYRLPEPINSDKNDYGFISTASMNSGYFTSDREGKDQIYSFNTTYPSFTNCVKSKEPKLCFTFSEEDIYEEHPPIKYRWNFGDGASDYGYKVNHCYKNAGNYTVKLDYIDTNTLVEYKGVGVYDLVVEKPNSPVLNVPDTVSENEQIHFSFKNEEHVEWANDFYWLVNNENFYHSKDMINLFNTIGKHHIILGYQDDLETEDSSKIGCAYKDVVVPLDKKRLLEEKSLSFIFVTDSLDSIQKDALNFLITNVCKEQKDIIRIMIDNQEETSYQAIELVKKIRKYLTDHGYPIANINTDESLLSKNDYTLTSNTPTKLTIKISEKY